MTRLIALILGMAAVAASVAYAAEGGEQGRSPAQFCKAERAALGEANFRSLYAPGANAFGKCVSKHARAAAANTANAAKACKAEMAMPEVEFRATHGGKSFAELYGRNENDRNAYGKCVSSKASAAAEQQEAALMKAAKACKAERAANRAAFVAKYGGKGSSAFGKCVSTRSKKQ